MNENALNVCRICLKQTDLFFSLSASNDLMSKLLDFIPQMDLNYPPNSIICNSCTCMIKNIHEFKLLCLQTEATVKNLRIQDLTLQSVLNAESSMKIEEVSVKEEMVEDSDNFEISSSAPKSNFQICAGERSKRDLFYCYHCIYSTEDKKNLIEHTHVHQAQIGSISSSDGITHSLPEVLESITAPKSSLSNKSKNRYETAYQKFVEWAICKELNIYSENCLLTYFQTMVSQRSLWSVYSMLRSCLLKYKEIDTSKFTKVTAYVKETTKTLKPKKSGVLSDAQIYKFLTEAPDSMFLLMKVVLVMGISGACRREELCKMSVQDVQLKPDVVIVKIPNTETNTSRSFTIINKDWIDIIFKYAKLRPQTERGRFFLTYRNGKCVSLPVGLNTIGKIPMKIAKYLQLENAAQFTGHSFRRSSVALLVDHGGDLLSIKRNRGWRSSTGADAYFENTSMRSGTELPEKFTEATVSSILSASNLNLPSGSVEDPDDGENKLVPHKSKKIYEKELKKFENWCSENQIEEITENVLLAYFETKGKVNKSSTLWTKYSMLRTMLSARKNLDISKFVKLLALLKRLSKGYRPKKSNILQPDDIDRFINEAPNDKYLAMKVALILGYSGGCSKDELINIQVDDIEYKPGVIIVSVSKIEKNVPRLFAITNEQWIEIITTYANSRVAHTNHRRFFVAYHNGRCTIQPIGKNTMAQVPKSIATYLELPNPESFSGHCFRRSSATHLADRGDIVSFKGAKVWKTRL